MPKQKYAGSYADDLKRTEGMDNVIKMIDYADRKWTDVYQVSDDTLRHLLKVIRGRGSRVGDTVVLEAGKLPTDALDLVIDITIKDGINVSSGRQDSPETGTCAILIRLV